MELTEKKAPVWIIGGSFLYNHYINHPYLDNILQKFYMIMNVIPFFH